MSARIRTAATAVRDWILSPVTMVAAVLVAVAAGLSLWLSPPCTLRDAPALAVTEGFVEIPAEHRAAADAAAADFKDYRWADGCHSFVRTPRGAVYWVMPGGVPNINTWEVGRRGWPKGGCLSPTTPDYEPCDRNGVPVCGVGGSYGPGITDGLWQNVSDPRPQRVPA
ncbi:hypothetical protein ABQE69_10905 [Mycolicibacillus trivialis]|uniref:hypothetical protein n=1 Tax=Mycobacteroides abscessus TaxID=36809 RepID=UPI0009A8567E|nr:hypothetical protein [Mycobacteroides abscessus]SLG53835.1 Uncharacterised protein [Mycobacteroides abscessus subsp. massiliense]SLH95348.1 Uncharacterised protein [Mycobacteroides abscessus subsp. massiliense]